MSQEIYYVDTSERKTFEALDLMGKNYVKSNNILWFCEDCDQIYKEKPKVCECGSNKVVWEKVGDIRGADWEYAIEIKIGDDLYSSLEGRIYRQMEGLAGFFKGHVAIVFVGDLFKLANKYPDRAGQILSIPATCMQYGISFITIKDITELIKLLKYFDYKSKTPPKLRLKRIYVTDLMPKRSIIFSAMKGVGPKLVLRLAQRYKSPFEFALDLHTRDSVEIAKDFDGVGIKTVKKWKEWFL